MKKQGRGFIWSPEQENELILIYNNKTLSELSLYFKRSEIAIRAKALKLKLNRDLTRNYYNRKWTDKEEQYLKNNYFGGDLKEIAKKLNRTKKSVIERAKLLKIKRNHELVRLNSRKYTTNEDFFKTWSDDMAYILGLIWTDGCMLDKNYTITITQHKKDKYILDNILKIMGSNNKPYRNENTYNIGIYNKIIYEDLKKLGLEPRKSKTAYMPGGLPDDFIGSFIRGTVDGDGSINSKRNRMKISTASKNFADGLCGLLDKVGIKYKLYNEPYIWNNTKTDFYNIRILKKSELKKLYHLMYDNATLYLRRKKQAFIDMGIETEYFLTKNKHIARKIEGTNLITGEKVQYNQIKDVRQNFPRIFTALKSRKPYKGYTWKYL